MVLCEDNHRQNSAVQHTHTHTHTPATGKASGTSSRVGELQAAHPGVQETASLLTGARSDCYYRHVSRVRRIKTNTATGAAGRRRHLLNAARRVTQNTQEHTEATDAHCQIWPQLSSQGKYTANHPYEDIRLLILTRLAPNAAFQEYLSTAAAEHGMQLQRKKRAPVTCSW